MTESEKITINIGVVDLGKVDLLVEEGFYSNRTDLIRTAIRNQLDKQQDEVRESITRRQSVLGLVRYDRKYLEKRKAANEAMSLSVVGLLSLAPDITPELARETIDSVKVVGVFQASQAVKAALADRTH